MGIKFDDNTANYLQVTDASVLNLPDSDWAFGIWEFSTGNAGTQFRNFVSSGLSGNSVSSWFWKENSNATYPGVNSGFLINNAGTTILSAATAETLSATTWTTASATGTKPVLHVIQRVGNNIERYWANPQAAATRIWNYAASNWTALDPPELEFGRRADGAANRAYAGTLGHYWQIDGSLSQAEVDALAYGSSIFDLGIMPTVYVPMAANVANPPSLVGGLTITRNGTLADGPEFPVFLDQATYVEYLIAAGSSGVIHALAGQGGLAGLGGLAGRRGGMAG